MGRRVMAAAHVLHYRVGIPVRRVPSVLRALTGVELSQSTITQDALRRAVIARKVSHCSKTEGGADAFGAFTSVIRALARKGGGQSVVDGLCVCVQRHAWPRPLHLNLFPTSTPPLINYPSTKGWLTIAGVPVLYFRQAYPQSRQPSPPSSAVPRTP